MTYHAEELTWDRSDDRGLFFLLQKSRPRLALYRNKGWFVSYYDGSDAMKRSHVDANLTVEEAKAWALAVYRMTQ